MYLQGRPLDITCPPPASSRPPPPRGSSRRANAAADAETYYRHTRNADSRSNTDMDFDLCTDANCKWAGCYHLNRAHSVFGPDGIRRPHPDRPVGSDGQRLAINTSHGERLPAGHKAPRDVHVAERGGNGRVPHTGRAQHGALDGQPERNDVSAGNAGAGRDRDSDAAGRDDPMKEKP